MHEPYKTGITVFLGGKETMKRKNVGFLTGAALALIIALGAARTQAAALQPTADTGTASSVDSPEQIILAALPQATPQGQSAQQAISLPLHGVPQAVFEALKAQAAAGSIGKEGSTQQSPLGNAPSAPQAGGVLTPFISVGFAGAKQGCAGGGSFAPSDMGLAVNQTFVLQAVNSCVSVFDKTGVLQAGFPKTLDAFMGQSATTFIFDPRALYDWVNNRFIVTATHCRSCETGSNVSVLDIAVSQTSDPRGGWNVYHLNVQSAFTLPLGAFADFPRVGQDRRAIYVSFNEFSFPSGNFIQTFVVYLSKANMYAGAALGSFNFNFNFNGGGGEFDSIQPANIMNKADNPRANFMVNSENIEFGGGACSTGCDNLVVWSVANPIGPAANLKVFGVFVTTANTFSLPPQARQPGAVLVDTNDVRISGEVTYASGSLFGSLNTNGTGSGAGESHILWFQLRPFLNDTPDITGVQILNEDCYFCSGQGSGATGSTFYGTLQPDPEGNVMMVFSYSDDATNVESAYVSRRVTQAQNTMHDSGIVLQSGLAAYADGRWGDYNGTAPDLTNPISSSMWVAADSAKTAHVWRSAIGNVHFKVTDP